MALSTSSEKHQTGMKRHQRWGDFTQKGNTMTNYLEKLSEAELRQFISDLEADLESMKKQEFDRDWERDEFEETLRKAKLQLLTQPKG